MYLLILVYKTHIPRYIYVVVLKSLIYGVVIRIQDSTNRFDLPTEIYDRLTAQGAKVFMEYSHYDFASYIHQNGGTDPSSAISSQELIDNIYSDDCGKSDAAKHETARQRLKELYEWGVLDRYIDATYYDYYVSESMEKEIASDGSGVPALSLSALPDIIAALPLTSSYGRYGVLSLYGGLVFVFVSIISIYLTASVVAALGFLTLALAAFSFGFVASLFGIMATVSQSDPATWFLSESS